jgi:cytoskeletal protein RodZ
MDTVQRQPRGTEFGEFLRGARERRGLTLLQVSNETRIPWRHLDAFERGDLTVVPNGMYRRAEVRAYARAVGLDQSAALTELERALIAAGLTPAPPEPHARVARPVVIVALGIAGVAGALLATWLLWTNESVEAPAASARPAPAPAAVPPPSAPTTADAAQARGASGDAIPSVAGTSFKAPTAERASIATSSEAVSEPADTTAPRAGRPVSAAEEGLVVTSDPPGARVMLDGVGWGTTPLTIRFLPAGDRTLRVIKDGFVSEERRVHVAGGRATTVNLTLQTTR